MSPAPALRNVPDSLVDELLHAQILTALDARDVAHLNLKEGPPNLNANLSDERHVFVKVTRPGAVLDRAAVEVHASRWAHDHGLDCPQPLVPDPLILQDAVGRPRAVTVLSWVETCSGPALKERALAAVDLVSRIAAIPAPPTATCHDLDFYLDRVERRLHGVDGDDARLILHSARDQHRQIGPVLALADRVWSHCDLHLGNLGWLVNGRPVVFDWESAGSAPVEVDIAQIVRSVMTLCPGWAPEERRSVARAALEKAHAVLRVDLDLVDALCRFRAASHASHLLTAGNDSVALRSTMEYLRGFDRQRQPLVA